MLSKAFEWYRVVNVAPNNELLNSRKAAASDLIAAIAEAQDWTLPFNCVAGVVAGFDHAFAPDADVVTLLVNIIREHDSAIPGDLSENALELRVIAALALGEILVRNGDKPDRDAAVIGSVLQSGLYIRPLPQVKHLRQIIDELAIAADNTRRAAATRQRKPVASLRRHIDDLTEPADIPSVWNALVSALNKVVDDVATQSAQDREELDLLWWMFAESSMTTGRQLAQMAAGAAALCTGVELADRCLVPATPSLEAMIRRAFATKRKTKDLAARTVESFASDWEASLRALLVPTEHDRLLAKTHPSLFPLAWLSDRLIESNGAPGWLPEFERKTVVSGTHAVSTVDWAIQAFRERVSLRHVNE